MSSNWCYMHNGPLGSLGQSCICGRAPHYAPNPPSERPGAVPMRSLTEERVRQIVREELARNAATAEVPATGRDAVTASGGTAGTAEGRPASNGPDGKEKA